MTARGAFDAETVERIWARDQGMCARCGLALVREQRGQTWAIHHRRPRSMGGSSLPWVAGAANGLVLCNECHAAVESSRDEARARGFLVSAIGRLRADEVEIRHALFGRCLLTDEGWIERVEVGPTPESIEGAWRTT